MQNRIAYIVLLLVAGLSHSVAADIGRELIKDWDMTATDAFTWQPYGTATITKIKDGGMPTLKVETVRRGSPGGRCGTRGEIGNVAAGDVLRVEICYRVINGGALTLIVGVNMELGLNGLNSSKDATVLADVPVRKGGRWSFWLVQNMNARRGEFLVKRFSARVVEQGDPARFPIVIDGDMEQPTTVFYSAYGKSLLSKDDQVVRSGKRSLRVVSYEDDRPGSVYAGVAVNLGPFDAKKVLKVSFDIKVASGSIVPMMTRGAFDKGYEPVSPGDWKHVEIEYETPLNGWYSIIFTRTADVPFEFWLDNVQCEMTG